MDVTTFNEKLNLLEGNIYTIEEEVVPVNGIYENALIHDNVTKSTINVYTGSQLTGNKITTYTLSTPSLAPWKTVIKIFSNETTLFITYETIGDQVEADDINDLQNSVVDTQENLNNEIERAVNSESSINNNLNSEINRATISEFNITDTINTNKPNWDDKYTKNEVDNKLSALVTSLNWKESVDSFNDISINYPTPDDGWTVNVKDTDITYRYDGTTWIPISANSIPLATSLVDGKMSKQDKINHDDMNSKKHTHDNKGVIDIITQVLIDNWNIAYNNMVNGTIGNADMVDGKHASDFAPSGFGLGSTCEIATGDWNNYKTTGFFMGSGLTNECLGSGWRFCIVMGHNDIWTSQTMIDFSGTTVYQRNQSNGVWGQWRKILTSNQGITWNDLKGV